MGVGGEVSVALCRGVVLVTEERLNVEKPPPPSIATPAAPGPVSSQATVTGSCVIGYEPAHTDSNGGIAYGPFTAGPLVGNVTIGSTQYTSAVAYQLTLTNTSTSTAAVDGFIAVFYDASGQELGSDLQTFYSPVFVTSGQALAWTEYSGNDMAGYGVSGGSGGQDDNIPSSGDAATCQYVEYAQP